MIRYYAKNKKTEVRTNTWTSDFADETYYEASFGKLERWVLEGQEDISEALETRENDLGQTEYKLAAEFEIESEDLGNEPYLLKIRSERNSRLLACDWTQLADSPLSNEDRAAWAEYRQALRDLPQREDLNLDSPQWPEEP